MLDDIRYACRLMTRQKAFTAATLITLALGVGANTSIFSMVYGVLLRPLPYAHAHRLVRLSESHPGGTPIVSAPMISNVTFHGWRETLGTIAAIAAYTNTAFTVSDRDSTSRVRGSAVTPGLFELVGARPWIGRLFQDQDADPNGERVVVLGGGFWQARFGGQTSAIGRTILLDGQSYLIVGVLPPNFYFPDRDVELWVPLLVPNTPAIDRLNIFASVALLRPGVTADQAASEGTAVARAQGPRHLSANLLFGTGGPPTIAASLLMTDMTSSVRPALLVLLVAVALVLLVACANVASLLLSRNIVRRRELAVRAALGASQRRLARQLVTETAVLSMAGGVLGAALGWALTRAIAGLAPDDFPRLADIRMDGIALIYASVVAAFVAALTAVPLVRAARLPVAMGLRDGTGASASTRTRRYGFALLAGQAALAVILLVAAGLLGRSFVRLLGVDPGYNPANVLMARIYLTGEAAAVERRQHVQTSLLDRVRALPGVVAVGVSNMAPLVATTGVVQVTLRGDSADPITARALSYVVTPGYGEALGMHVLEGRLFEEQDLTADVRPMILNEEFVRGHFADGRPVVGRRFVNPLWGSRPVEIIGVVRNVLKDGLDTNPQPEMYNVPGAPFAIPAGFNIAIRTTQNPTRLVSSLRHGVREADPLAAVDDLETLAHRVSDSVAQPRFAMAVLIAMATLALVITVLGLYGVLSYDVSQRRREIGVRIALGASRRSIVTLVVTQGAVVTAIGVLVGLAAAAALMRLIQGMLFGVTAYDRVAYTLAPLTLMLVAVAATLVPAWRAANVAAIDALRQE
jgi:putative ABC transport system permease protein